jgi:hypothetical protein
MKETFQKYNLTIATQIFTVPYHTGDENTINLAKKYGYKLIEQKLTIPKTYSEKNDSGIIATQDYIDVPLKDILGIQDSMNYSIELNKAINLKQNRIMVSLHPVNFHIFMDTDYFFKKIINQTDTKIKFGFISDRFQ